MALGTIKVEVLESVDGVSYALNGTALATGVAQGVTIVAYTSSPGVRYVKFRITEEGTGPIGVSCVAGVM